MKERKSQKQKIDLYSLPTYEELQKPQPDYLNDPKHLPLKKKSKLS